MPAYSELIRRLGFEYKGMVLHEYYFDNLTKSRQSELTQLCALPIRPRSAEA